MVPTIERGTTMYRSTESPPIQVVWPPAPIANDNGDVTLADASVAQLLRAVRGKIDSQPENLRPLMSQLVRSRLVYLLEEGRS
jgi:hypothetical protein